MMLSQRLLLLATCATLALAACSPGKEDGRMAGKLAPAASGNVTPPALPLAGAHGLTDSVYFNDELQQARSRLDSMRKDMEMLSAKLASLQTRLSGVVSSVDAPVPPLPLPVAAPGQEVVTTTTTEIVPATTTLAEVAASMPVPSAPMPAEDPTQMSVPAVAAAQTTTTTTTVKTPDAAAPTPITGVMGKPAEATPMKPVVDEKKDAKPAAAKPAEVKAADGAAGVTGVRFGTHADKVRVVLDVNGTAEGAVPAIDAANSVLTITLPKTKWVGTATQPVAKNPMIASYSAQPAGDGSVVAFILKGSAKIARTSIMKNPTRVVVDLEK